MTTTYLGAVANEQLDQAQAEVDRHVVVGLDGRCIACREVQPCSALQRASRTFAGYGRLPVRRPGMAGRVIGDSEVGFGWLANRALREQALTGQLIKLPATSNYEYPRVVSAPPPESQQ